MLKLINSLKVLFFNETTLEALKIAIIISISAVFSFFFLTDAVETLTLYL